MDYNAKRFHYDLVQREIRVPIDWEIFDVENMDDFHPFNAFMVEVNPHPGHSGFAPIGGPRWRDVYIAVWQACRNAHSWRHAIVGIEGPDEEDGVIKAILN
jgi:hypothetical protein